MKVVHLTTVHRTKDTRIFYRYCKGPWSKNIDSYLISPLDNDLYNEGDTVKIEGVEVSFLKKRSSSPLRSFRSLFLIIKHLKRIKSDILHVHDPELLVFFPILFLFARGIVYDIHEDNYSNIMQKNKIPFYLRPLIAISVRFLEKIVYHIFNTAIAERYYEEFFPNAIKVLNYPGEYSKYPFELLEEIYFDKSYSWFIYTGNITLERGAIEQLKILKDDARFAIFYIGFCDRATYKKITDWLESENIATERFKIKGVDEFVSQPIINYYQSLPIWSAGLAIFPYDAFYERKELTKFFEYYNNKIVILCSDFNGWRGFVEKYDVGVLYTEGYIDRLKDKKVDFERWDFSWSSQVKKVESLYNEIVYGR